MNIRVFACLAVLILSLFACGDGPFVPRPPEPPTVYPPPPTIAHFTASTHEVKSGEYVQLVWAIKRVLWVTLSDGAKIIYTFTAPLVGGLWHDEVTNAIALNVYPTATTTYTLTGRNNWGAVTASLTVTVK